jgi:hypothetical protein
LTIEQRPKRLRRVPGGVAGRIARDFDKLGKKGDLGCKIVVSDDVFGGNLRGASADASVFMVASIPSIARHRDDAPLFQGGTTQALVDTFTPRA